MTVPEKFVKPVGKTEESKFKRLLNRSSLTLCISLHAWNRSSWSLGFALWGALRLFGNGVLGGQACEARDCCCCCGGSSTE